MKIPYRRGRASEGCVHMARGALKQQQKACSSQPLLKVEMQMMREGRQLTNSSRGTLGTACCAKPPAGTLWFITCCLDRLSDQENQ